MRGIILETRNRILTARVKVFEGVGRLIDTETTSHPQRTHNGLVGKKVGKIDKDTVGAIRTTKVPKASPRRRAVSLLKAKVMAKAVALLGRTCLAMLARPADQQYRHGAPPQQCGELLPLALGEQDKERLKATKAVRRLTTLGSG